MGFKMIKFGSGQFFLLLVIIITIACQVSAEITVFTFTAIPDQNTVDLEERFSKIAYYLKQKLDRPVKYVPVKSYSASVQAFKNNQVQLAWFGGLSGVQARLAVPNSQAIAQGRDDSNFITYLIANTNTGLSFTENFPTNIVGKTFTFGSKGSTSGRLMPEYFIRQALQKTPRLVFRRVGYSGDHTKTLALVQSGSYEVGAINYKVWQKAVSSGKIDAKRVQVIWRTPAYPDYNWPIRGDVDQTYGVDFSQKVQQALIQITDPEILDAFPRAGFIPADNSMFQPILDIAIEVGIIRQ